MRISESFVVFVFVVLAAVVRSSAHVVELTPRNFETHVGQSKPALVEFYGIVSLPSILLSFLFFSFLFPRSNLYWNLNDSCSFPGCVRAL